MIRRILAILSCFLLILGCNKQIDLEEETAITVLFPYQPMFHQKYGMFFEQAMPHIQLRVVEEMLQETDQELCCDLIFINDVNMYRELAAAGKLLILDDWIRRDDFKIKEINPFVLDQLYLDDGSIYGLAPRFESKALYYNEQLFKAYGIPLPHNGMNWDELLGLAQRFPIHDDEGEMMYGFVSEFFRDVPVLLALRIASAQNLFPIDPASLTVQVNSAEWTDIWRTVLNAYQSGVIYDPSLLDVEFVFEEPFLEGRAALQIANQVTAYYLRDLRQADERMFEWNVVTVPAQQSGTARNQYMLHDIFAIAANSNHSEAAWEFIQYIHSDSFIILTEEYPPLINAGFPTRMKRIPEVEGRSMEPFFITDANNGPKQEEVPQEIIDAFVQVASEEMGAVLREEKKLEDAIEGIQFRGQIAVDEAREIYQN